ncbi:MAG TPA: hypothetical protein VGH07_00280 [Chthoniobacterales bacterium]
MKTIRVFVSSPGDVQAERTIADRLIRTIAEELAIPVSVQYSNLLRNGEAGLQLNSSGELESGELILCPYFWEYQRFSPEFGYQDQIPNTAQFDLVISILWSRLGTKLHPRFHMPDGSEPRSGTEFEIAWAKEQRAKTPGVPALIELRANPQGVAGRVKDKLNQVASEYRLRQEQRLRELESDFREQKREADAANAGLQREKLEPPRARLVLVVDQLEELFTSGFSEELQLKFVNSLAVLARSGRVFVLVTLRNDFYARYQQFTDLVELTKPSGKYDLQPPTLQELGRMIRLPAQAAGLEFERDEALGQTLDEALRDGAAADPQALPLLEHVLTRLYELQEKRGDRILSWSDYRELGEMNGALANHAEEVFGTLRPDEQAAFPLAMGYLVTLGQGEEEVPNRRTAPYHDFLGRGDADHKPRAGAKGFVDRFIEKRLLIADTLIERLAENGQKGDYS